MAHPLSPGPHRSPSGLARPDEAIPAEHPETGRLPDRTATQESAGLTGGRFYANPFAFVCFAIAELAFVFGLLVLTRLSPEQILQVAGGTTAISVGGFFGRNAVVIVGRRLMTRPDGH